MGYIYIIQMGSFDIYKVGITSYNPSQRLAQLQTGNPYKLEIVSLYQLDSNARLERMLHDSLARYRMEGEWFNVDLDTIRQHVDGLGKLDTAKSKLGEIVRRNPRLAKVVPKQSYN